MACAPALLRHHRADALLEEHATWERVRARLHAHAPYAPPADPNVRQLIVLDGMPGSGKTTARDWLQPALGARYCSLARFAEERGVSADARREHHLQHGEPHPVDVAFLAHVLEEGDARFTLVEKLGRTVIEAHALLSAVHERGVRLDVVHLELPGDCVAASTQRQLGRGARRGQTPTEDGARHRALVHLARATPAREWLRERGVPIHTIDTTRPPDETRAAIRRALGLDFESLAWHRPPLVTLDGVVRRLGMTGSVWVANGAVYRPFFNGRFGPAQQPADVDVAVDEERQVAPLLAELERVAAHERWSVLCPSTRLLQRCGISSRGAVEAKRHATWLHRAGLLRLDTRGAVELALAPGAEAALRNGRLELNPARPADLDLAHDLERAQRTLADYPRLTFGSHAPAPVHASWQALKEAAGTGAPAPRLHNRRALTADELRVAGELIAFHANDPHVAQAPPLPARVSTPRAGGALETLAREANDAEFAAWFFEQVHSHRARPDPYLKAVLDFTLFERALRARSRDQSPLHQGWQLERHLAQSVLELKTDGLLEQLRERHPTAWRLDVRLAMRLAMLFHDTGKLAGRKPQRHGHLSARLFARFRPAWFEQRLVPLTQWLIRTHDVFGALGRGLTEPGYRASLDVQAVRRELSASGLPLADAA
ncbi:MAG: hypothetical protein JNK82_33320, partial [Myxococcaceae bacterium]|nr:hypothetical protein [Myxococcaceae bacterium]